MVEKLVYVHCVVYYWFIIKEEKCKLPVVDVLC